MSTDYRDRFSLSAHPFSKQSTNLFIFESENFKRFQERFSWSLSDRGLYVLTGESGVGKTTCLHKLTRELPPHQFRVLYLEDSLASLSDLYRSLAYALGLEPAFRRSTLWRQLKEHIVKLNDENDQQVVVIIDDAHRLSGAFLDSLSAFMNFLFDSRDLLTVWLVGDSHLVRVLSLASHRHLMTRLRLRHHMEAMDRKELQAYLKNCLSAAGCNRQVCSEQALEAVFKVSRGIPRTAGKLLGVALRIAHEQKKDQVCDEVIDAAREVVLL